MLIYNPTTRLSKHFTMAEVARSDTATRLRIDNTPTPIVLEAAKLLAVNVLEPIRVHFGIPFAPTSWYRGDKLERTINDVSYRQWCARLGIRVSASSWKKYLAKKSHPKGEAADIEIPGIPNDELFSWIKKNVSQYDQLIREFPRPGDAASGWVHVSFSANNRKQDFVIN